MAERCREKAQALLDAYETPPMDSAMRDELNAYVSRRQEQISPILPSSRRASRHRFCKALNRFLLIAVSRWPICRYG